MEWSFDYDGLFDDDTDKNSKSSKKSKGKKRKKKSKSKKEKLSRDYADKEDHESKVPGKDYRDEEQKSIKPYDVKSPKFNFDSKSKAGNLSTNMPGNQNFGKKVGRGIIAVPNSTERSPSNSGFQISSPTATNKKGKFKSSGNNLFWLCKN